MILILSYLSCSSRLSFMICCFLLSLLVCYNLSQNNCVDGYCHLTPVLLQESEKTRLGGE